MGKGNINLKAVAEPLFSKKAIAALILCVIFVAGILATFLSFFIPLGFLNMGMNIGQNNYYTRQLIYTDLFKTASNLDVNIPLDENGYPQSIPIEDANQQTVNRAMFLINNWYEGEYTFLYDGDGDFIFSGDNASDRAGGFEVLGKNGENRFDFILHRHGGHRYIIITRSNPENPVKNFRIIPTKYVGKEDKMPLFRKDFLDGLKSLHAIRFMDAGKINSSTQQHWETRSIPNKFINDTAAGMPYEYMIELANTLKKDAWICVPHMATDDYHIKLAQMLKENLDPSLKLYIEYSNEVWNTAPAFNQSAFVDSNAPSHPDQYVSTDLRLIGEAGQSQRIKSAYMQARTHRLFKSVFTGKDRARLVTVGAIHTNDWIEETKKMIKYWKNNAAMPDAIAGTAYFGYETSHWNYEALKDILPIEKAEDLNNYFHNIWNSNPLEVTADDIIDAVELLWDKTIAPAAKLSAEVIIESGARYILYEGGQHMQPHNQGEWEYNQAVWDAQISPRMYDLYIKNFYLQKELGCDLFMNFAYTSQRESRWGSWGALENQSDIYTDLKITAPKFKAILDANNRNGFLG